jgi:hypothetical protein
MMMQQDCLPVAPASDHVLSDVKAVLRVDRSFANCVNGVDEQLQNRTQTARLHNALRFTHQRSAPNFASNASRVLFYPVQGVAC